MKAMEVFEKLTPEILDRVEEIIDNKPEQEQDWR
jgi:hypothetical protein